jgi:CelD/BcsL family acetyltransferase involved in cellulose biosynthesis
MSPEQTMHAITGPYQCAVITDVPGFTALESEWNALHAASPRAYVSDGFDWARLCWDFVGDQPGRGLFCAVVRRHSQLVAVWPLTVSRTGVWRLARALTSQGTEYCPFLVHPDADLHGVWTAICREFEGRGDVDALSLPYVREDSPLGRCLSKAAGSRRLYSLPVRFLRRAEFADWESYFTHLPHNVQVHQRRDWRRLDLLGEAAFEDVSDPAERQAVWTWMVAKKREWLVRRGLRSPSISSDSFARFVARSLDVFAQGGRRRIFALKLDGAVIAAELVNVDRARVELFVLTFDEAFARCAPGNLLREKVVAWAFERGLDYDWRLGDESYKQIWANHVAQATSYVLPLTPRGKYFVRYAVARQRVAERTPEPLRVRVASILRGDRALA